MQNSRIQLRFALPTLVLLATLIVGCSDSAPVDPELSARLIQPVAHVALDKSQPEEEMDSDAPIDPEAIYTQTCAACHTTGVAGAPKIDEAGDWTDRIEQGLDALVASAINGLGAMPPRGGNPNLSDEAIHRTVVYMANLAGADFSAE
ncbi:MAG TPA: c-type cytochrome [Azoarcus sp.]|nr:c-type cytochrome [Azoarcus sp.]